MRNMVKLFGFIALVAIIGFTMAALSLTGCDNGNGGGGDLDPQPSIPQSVTYVSSDGDGNLYTLEITENTGRSARYTAKNGDAFKFIVELFNNGNYSVALTYSGTVESAEGSGTEIVISITVNGKPLTITISGATMTVISGTIVLDNEDEITITEPLTVLDTPEKLPVQKRWYSWVDDTSTVTLNYSVDNDGVCKITVGGRAQPNNATDDWGKWKAHAGYSYTAEANTSYKYEFEAWTESGNRTLRFQYYNDTPGSVWLYKDVTLTNKQETYTIWGENIPKNGVRSMEFQCADQLGTFYVKVISITPIPPPEQLPDAERWYSWAEPDSGVTIAHSVANDGVVTVNVGGTAITDTSYIWKAGPHYQYSTEANASYTYEFEAWTQSGNRTLYVQYYNGSHSNETLWLGQEVTIDSTRKTYRIVGSRIPKGRICVVEFQCANQTGTFYVKMLSITPR